MRYTENGLIRKGILKVDEKHNYLNAIIDCSGSEGMPVKGIWIMEKYYPAIYVWDSVYFEIED